MRTVLTCLTLSLSLFGCAGGSPSLDSTADAAKMERAREMLRELGMPVESRSWAELNEISDAAYEACLRMATEKFDDGVSPAGEVALVVSATCADYFQASIYTSFRGDAPSAGLRSAQKEIATAKVLQNRAGR